MLQQRSQVDPHRLAQLLVAGNLQFHDCLHAVGQQIQGLVEQRQQNLLLAVHVMVQAGLLQIDRLGDIPV